MKKSFVKKYLWNRYAIVGFVVLLIILYFSFFRGSKTPKFDFAIASIGDVTERVSVTGKISPVEKADLAFEKSGRLVSIKVKIGERVKKGDIIASLDTTSDRASLASAEAKLADLSRGLNVPESALEQSKINAASVSLANAKQDALNAIRSAFVTTQGAISNYTDTFFDNPQSANPTINIQTSSYISQSAINYDRIVVSDTLNSWKKDLDQATSSDMALKLILAVNSYEVKIKAFMDRLSIIVNDLSTGNSGLTRATIDSHVSTMNSGLSSLSQAIASIATAKTTLENSIANYDQIYNNFLLKNSGSSAQSVAAQMAVVETYRAELGKNKLISPIDGIITRIDPDLGEFISPGVIVFSVISGGDYKIEAYVPEADIAKVSFGDMASTTLDAYGQTVDFPTVVTAIDPAETILEGVPTYKITLQFINKDERIKSGMTANLDILSNKKTNVVTIPTRAVQTSNGIKTVRVLDATGKKFNSIPVEVGLKGSDGMIEIISGINVGDKVVTYVK